MAARSDDASPITGWGHVPSLRAERVIGAAVFLVFYIPYFAIIVAARAIEGGFTPAIAGFTYLIAVWLWVGSRGLRALTSNKAIPATDDNAPRFVNIARGVANDMGVGTPSLWVIPIGGPNALACDARGPAVAVTQSLLDSFTRTELEAVVANCLVRLRPRAIRAEREAVALGLFAPKVELVGTAQDVATVEVTRYPPALASAIDKATPQSGPFAPYWFVANDPTHMPPGARAAAIRDL